ncbi:zinc-dependent alcohol dehydrogenase family protein [Pseudonocardia sp. KRD-184]|uniref:Zinc-dependent alcohol dehydrogenase family protein n=1 Tax=Pseudonocardia oceani TaxID=2792013 RepID=A0ABS6UE16_9PSEU|nr:zinc-dependent alcohol dehydrogenase family protein [Pseudonocardia oceani]MBW0094158.1 zinc-dependent alcohol dehydrogenase family protein [Pseudonocardia oceani]MBW0098318.1 zinc-dependent alcohol dehydrogenase family protein [Pseudonocardia oceani]MBW0110877.1 zinc-dependent alcohol dehydrogenase family protein [Pseudonocardia oceani]MBW0121977.1 zinc-dependent alcohol dehydrogenase family protein [Pseudonocardia oceani]MBW0130493.1 zinc-dependent alcohol dehydrogenase family protein [Ps
MARTIRFHETGGPEVLRIEDLPVRAPGPGEVRIRVDAIGLNRAEVNFRRGTYLEQPVLPAGLGSEAAGEVLEAGPDVGRWRAGDPVCVIPAFSQNDFPVYAEEAVVPAAALVARPPGMDAVTGAAVWMPYVTVYGMVQEVVRVRPGDRVVVTAAANSIGLAAVQVLRHLGAVPVATVTAPAGRDALLAAGAAEVVVDDGSGLAGPLRAATGGAGADLVLDAVGGPRVAELVAACAPGATVLVHGGLSGEPTPLPGGRYAPVWMRRYLVFEITGDPAALRRAEHFVRAGLACGAFVPTVDRVFDFDDVAAAHAYVDSPDRAPGKPVLRVRPTSP